MEWNVCPYILYWATGEMEWNGMECHPPTLFYYSIL